MKKSLCELVLVYYPRIFEVEDFLSISIANCVFNSFLSYTAIMLNIVTIHAIRKTPSLPKTLKTLLLSLAVSDVGVGFLVQPFYTSLLVKWIQQMIPNCSTYEIFSIIGIFFGLASFLGVVAVSVDRFLAIHLHLRYQELVTHKRVVAVVISIWVFSLLLSLFYLWVYSVVSYTVFAVMGVVCLVFSAMLYLKIYFTVRRHRNQIQALQVLQVQQIVQNDQITIAARLRKSATGVFYIYLVFLLCYLPRFCSFALVVIFDLSTGVKVFSMSSVTLLFLNSSLNPVIYCWKMRQIRRAVMDIVRNIFPTHN